MPRYFTIDDANALLPFLREVLPEVLEKKRAFDRHREALSGISGKSRGNGHAVEADVERHQREAERLREELQHLVERIRATGCEVKDLDVGLIDFPAIREDRVIYLCWRLDEPSVAWWHDVDAGFAGRQPL